MHSKKKFSVLYYLLFSSDTPFLTTGVPDGTTIRNFTTSSWFAPRCAHVVKALLFVCVVCLNSH